MNAQARNRVVGLAALGVAGAALALIVFASDKIGENLVYYWAPSEVLSNGEKAYGPTIRMGGVVKAGTIDWDDAKTTLRFAVADDNTEAAVSVPVVSAELPPQMFRDNIGVVVEGTFDASGTFTSNRLMVNHSNEYRQEDGTYEEHPHAEMLKENPDQT